MNQWIEEIICEVKPQKLSFEDWIADGTVLSKWVFVERINFINFLKKITQQIFCIKKDSFPKIYLWLA